MAICPFQRQYKRSDFLKFLQNFAKIRPLSYWYFLRFYQESKKFKEKDKFFELFILGTH